MGGNRGNLTELMQCQTILKAEFSKHQKSDHVIGLVLLEVRHLLDYDMAEFYKWTKALFEDDLTNTKAAQYMRLATAWPNGCPISMSVAGQVFLLKRKHTRYFEGAMGILSRSRRKYSTLKHAQAAIAEEAENMGTGFKPADYGMRNLTVRVESEIFEKIDELKEEQGLRSRGKVVEKAIEFYYSYTP